MFLRLTVIFLHLVLMQMLIMDFTNSLTNSITCEINVETKTVKLIVNYTGFAYVIKKDKQVIVSYEGNNCSFPADYKNITRSDCDLARNKYEISITILQRNTYFTPFGKWELEVADKNRVFLKESHCYLYMYAKDKYINCTVQEGHCSSISVACNIEKIYPEAVCRFWISKEEMPQTNVTYNHTLLDGEVPYYSTDCFINIKRTDIPNDHTKCSLKVAVSPNISDSKDNNTQINAENTVPVNMSDTLCQYGLTQKEILLSTNKDDDHSIHYTTIIVLSIVSSFLTLYLFIHCFKRNLQAQVNLKHKLISSKHTIQTEDLDNSDIYSFNILQHRKPKDDYCTIDRLSYCKNLTASKQSTRTALDFDPYSTIEECLLDKEIDTLLAYEYGNHENTITSIIRTPVKDRSKDDLPTKLVSKRHRDGNIYESIA
ncbi:uncharacterized protein LOC106079936 isoform X2 [Biomphalaria glabrata]|uniref:Uncharacterized protein LOC106079936 isoform X2 n=1 Tax=Biomphalaria glabrata TaxID=6526 RepID=A0A9W2YVG1_BIOGL|nr:uncharacterized protein LOC106079936 isoform X2 [Biomphalaria glabrata]